METQLQSPLRDDATLSWKPADPFASSGASLQIAVIADSLQLRGELISVFAEIGASVLFDLPPSASPIEVASALEKSRPDVLFVETAKLSRAPSEWIAEARRGNDLPLVVALHTTEDPEEMIRALRAGASEFLYLPLRPSVYEAIDRTATNLESRRAAAAQRGQVFGFLSAKGGCGATTIACYLAAALNQSAGKPVRVLVADLDCQSATATGILRSEPRFHVFDALEQIRRVNTSSWRELVCHSEAGVDVLGGATTLPPAATQALMEPWRIEALFRFMARNYSYVCVDLGRQLNPSNWAFLQNIDELYLVTAPDVLALFQTRTVLQTLASRGFDKSRIKLVLNRNQNGPQDFWKESIQQMFELQVYFVLPNDYHRLSGAPRERFQYPADTDFGRHMVKMAQKVAGVTVPKQNGGSLFRRAS